MKMEDIPTVEALIEETLNRVIQDFQKENPYLKWNLSITSGEVYLPYGKALGADPNTYIQLNLTLYEKVFTHRTFYHIMRGSDYNLPIRNSLINNFKQCLVFIRKYVEEPFINLPLYLNMDFRKEGTTIIYHQMLTDLIRHRLSYGA
jgi:hypothetical protein